MATTYGWKPPDGFGILACHVGEFGITDGVATTHVRCVACGQEWERGALTGKVTVVAAGNGSCGTCCRYRDECCDECPNDPSVYARHLEDLEDLEDR